MPARTSDNMMNRPMEPTPSDNLQNIAKRTLQEVTAGNAVSEDTNTRVKELEALLGLLRPATDEDRTLVRTLIEILKANHDGMQSVLARLEVVERRGQEAMERIAALETRVLEAISTQAKTTLEVMTVLAAMRKEQAAMHAQMSNFLKNFEDPAD